MQVRIAQLFKYYESGDPTVSDLNLDVADGELVTLLGPSGCGKSTTMLMIAGIHEVSKGGIYFDDELMNYVSPKDRNIGMVFQNPALYPNMNVLENITFPLRNRKMPKKQAEERAIEAAEIVQMAGYLKRKPSQLSGGQQQRVALARALAKQPKLLLLDEPLSSLDARLRMSLREEIRRIQKKLGITTVMVTHDQEEAMSMSDRIAVMNNGRLQQYGTPDELYENPVNWFVAQFLGMPSMNRLDCRWERPGLSVRLPDTGDVLTLPPSLAGVQDAMPEQRLMIGFRPHQVHIVKPEDESNSFKAKVLMIEFTGREKLLHLAAGAQHIKIYADLSEQVKEGDEIRLRLTHFRYLFDADTERNLMLNAEDSRELKEGLISVVR
ncbi:ATP-binding cassette domain-containing protein [Paenibacillus sp. LMG 31458]|uniref:ATP-binding cassette domain-containing protein n=1 Tax=Paenibacillus phytorum TaxID=2654977 RepID=A0ABX1XYA2_9BACL|nr:ABC transporter ATP-binding protein [Paenibacillus phytorum]NOU73557.1 ATP-binding cassette domain-containing protein [Paenibacillus phytorum]